MTDDTQILILFYFFVIADHVPVFMSTVNWSPHWPVEIMLMLIGCLGNHTTIQLVSN